MLLTDSQETSRWTARPRLAIAVRGAALLLPMIASFGVALLTQRWCDRVFPTAPWIFGAVVSLVAALVVLVIGERIGRRLMPLSMLLKLALLFPDQVPSRLGIALRAASPRRLTKKLESSDSEEAVAAERVLALVSALSAHDRLTRGHCERVRAVTMLLADEMGITGIDRDKLEWAALLHDVGKMTVSPAILNKRGKPNDDEWAELKTHPGNGAPLAGELSEWLGDWVHAIDQHHERFDGTGYPLGLAGDEITQGARIVATADAFEVMTAVRSYKKAMPVAAARAELAACQGTHFDPIVVRSFASLSVVKLHRALGPASWAMSLPFRGVVAQVVRGASAVTGGSAPTVLASLTGAFVLSMATVSMADAVDGRFEERHQAATSETASEMVVEELQVRPQDETAEQDEGQDPVLTPASIDQTAAEADDDESAADEEVVGEDVVGDDSPNSAPTNAGESGIQGDSANKSATGGGSSAALGSDPSAPASLDLAGLTDAELDLVGDVLAVDLSDLTSSEFAMIAELIEAADVLPALLDGTPVDVQGLVDTIATGLPALDTVPDTLNTVTDLGTSTADTALDLVEDPIDVVSDIVQDVTGVTVPTVSIPTVAIPTVAVPTVAIPTVAVPTVAVPTVAIPTVAVPTVAIPTVAIPIVAVPTVAVPTVAPTAIPIVAVPTVAPTAIPIVAVPTVAPTAIPIVAVPTVAPTAIPIVPVPTVAPTVAVPTVAPTVAVPTVDVAPLEPVVNDVTDLFGS